MNYITPKCEEWSFYDTFNFSKNYNFDNESGSKDGESDFDNKSDADTGTNVDTSTEASQYLSAYNKLSDNDQKRVDEIADAFKDTEYFDRASSEVVKKDKDNNLYIDTKSLNTLYNSGKGESGRFSKDVFEKNISSEDYGQKQLDERQKQNSLYGALIGGLGGAALGFMTGDTKDALMMGLLGAGGGGAGGWFSGYGNKDVNARMAQLYKIGGKGTWTTVNGKQTFIATPPPSPTTTAANNSTSKGTVTPVT